ncbi:MAG: hypothetical protein QF535_21425 [Anaerolineales bacterium]|nr:hypothetical protein [Anaerolineales bacterium]
MRISTACKITIFGLTLFMPILFFGRVFAHGGGDEQIVREKAGPYYVTVWSTSDVGSSDLHFTVAVGDQEDSPVLNASVIINVTPLDKGQPEIAKPATTGQSANKFRYETDFSGIETGVYLITVTINGDTGKGVTYFEMEHGYREDTFWWNAVVVLSVVVLGVSGFLYLGRVRRDT